MVLVLFWVVQPHDVQEGCRRGTITVRGLQPWGSGGQGTCLKCVSCQMAGGHGPYLSPSCSARQPAAGVTKQHVHYQRLLEDHTLNLHQSGHKIQDMKPLTPTMASEGGKAKQVTQLEQSTAAATRMQVWPTVQLDVC